MLGLALGSKGELKENAYKSAIILDLCEWFSYCDDDPVNGRICVIESKLRCFRDMAEFVAQSDQF